MLDRKKTPFIHHPISFNYKLPSCQVETLANQISLYGYCAGTQQVVMVEWVFLAGIWHESQTAIAQTTAALMKNGTVFKTALEINEKIDFYGATIKISASNDYTTVSLYAMSKHLQFLLPIVKEILTEAVFLEEEISIYKQKALQRLFINLKRSDFVANRYIDSFLFGRQHPYGRFTTEDDIRAIKKEDLLEFYHQNFYSANCRIFIAGQYEEHHLKLLNQYFGEENWGSVLNKDEVEKKIAIEAATEKKHNIINDKGSVQAAIRMARRFPTRQHPDFVPMIVLNTILGGYFGSRLMSNIREEKGYTYGIYSRIYNYKNDAALLIATETGREVAQAAIDEVYKEMDKLCSTPIADEELLLVKNYLLGSLLADLDGPFAVIQRWKSYILSGATAHRFDESIETYKQITANELLELSKKYFQKEDYYELTVV